MPEVDFLTQLQDDFKTQFHQEKSLLSFDEYLAVVQDKPQQSLRDAARYVRDLFDHFGTSEIQKPYATLTRFHSFSDLGFRIVKAL